MISNSLKFMLRGPAHSVGTLVLIAFIPGLNMLVTPLAMLVMISRGFVLGLVALFVAAAAEATAGQAYLAYLGETTPELQLPVVEMLMRYLAPVLMAGIVRYHRRIDWAMQAAWGALLALAVGIKLFSVLPDADTLLQFTHCIYGCEEGTSLTGMPDAVKGYWLGLIPIVVQGWAGLLFIGSAFCLYLAIWFQGLTGEDFVLKPGLTSWRVLPAIAVLAAVLGLAAIFRSQVPVLLVVVGWLSLALLGIAGLMLVIAFCQHYDKTWLWLTVAAVLMLIGILPCLLLCAVLAVADSLFHLRWFDETS